MKKIFKLQLFFICLVVAIVNYTNGYCRPNEKDNGNFAFKEHEYLLDDAIQTLREKLFILEKKDIYLKKYLDEMYIDPQTNGATTRRNLLLETINMDNVLRLPLVTGLKRWKKGYRSELDFYYRKPGQKITLVKFVDLIDGEISINHHFLKKNGAYILVLRQFYQNNKFKVERDDPHYKKRLCQLIALLMKEFFHILGVSNKKAENLKKRIEDQFFVILTQTLGIGDPVHFKYQGRHQLGTVVAIYSGNLLKIKFYFNGKELYINHVPKEGFHRACRFFEPSEFYFKNSDGKWELGTATHAFYDNGIFRVVSNKTHKIHWVSIKDIRAKNLPVEGYLEERFFPYQYDDEMMELIYLIQDIYQHIGSVKNSSGYKIEKMTINNLKLSGKLILENNPNNLFYKGFSSSRWCVDKYKRFRMSFVYKGIWYVGVGRVKHIFDKRKIVIKGFISKKYPIDPEKQKNTVIDMLHTVGEFIFISPGKK